MHMSTHISYIFNNISVLSLSPCLPLDTSLYIGLVTKQLSSKFEQEGDITAEVKRFYLAVRSFYVTASEYAFANLPLDDPVL